MELKTLACPNCRGTIDNFDAVNNRGVCPYCRTVVYRSSIVPNVGVSSTDGTLVFNDARSADALLEKARVLELQGEPDKAIAALYEMSEQYPGDKRAWRALYERLGLLRSMRERILAKYLTLADSKNDRAFLNEVVFEIDQYKEHLMNETGKIKQRFSDQGVFSDSASVKKMIKETQQLQASLSKLETEEKNRDVKMGFGCMFTIIALFLSVIAFLSGNPVLGDILLAAFLVPNVLIMVVLIKGSSKKKDQREKIEDLHKKTIDLKTYQEHQSDISELSDIKSKVLEILNY